MEAALREFVVSGPEATGLQVIYNDVHALWGGIKYCVRGDGTVERHDFAPGSSEPSTTRRAISTTDLQGLAGVLIEVEAWEQRVSEAIPLPDESRAHLQISLQGRTSRIWERFNDMESNGRLIRVKEFLESL